MKSFSHSLRLSFAYLLIFILSYLISGCGGKGSNPVTPNVNEKGSVKVDVKIKTLEPEKFSLADVDRVVISVYSGENQLGTTTVYPGGSSQVYFQIDNIPVGSGYRLVIDVCSSTSIIVSKTITGINVYQNYTTSISTPTIYISPPSSLTITPTEVALCVGENQQFTATATYPDTTTEDVTLSASWYSSNTSVAYFGGMMGELYASSAGTTNITATYQNVTSNTAVVTVEPAPSVTSIAITPTEVALYVGENQQFTAIATYSNGDTGNITTSVTWNSSNTSVAYFGSPGPNGLYASSAGTTNVTATYQGVTSNTALVTVEPAPSVTSITISPAEVTLSVYEYQQFTAIATYSNGDTGNITTSATWYSSEPTVAYFSAPAGNLYASYQGTTNVTATYQGITSNTAVVTVEPAPSVTSITISPAEVTLYVGENQPFTAIATYSNGDTGNITTSATWYSSEPTVAYFSAPAGNLYAPSLGTTNITATYQGITSNTAVVTVEPPPPPTSIAITPTEVTLYVGEIQQFTAIATYPDSTTEDITYSASATWNSSNTTVAYFSGTGSLSASSIGTTNVTTTYQGVTSNTALVTVEPRTPDSITISPTSAILNIGNAPQFTAIAHYEEVDITAYAEWSSSNPTVASFGATPGLLTASAKGEATVTATYKGVVSNTAVVTVGANTVSGIINTNTTWTLTDSPYIVTGNILVEQGISLTIEPGVVVKFNGNYYLRVNGTLSAEGTAGNEITFTSTAPGEIYWNNIRFTDTSDDALCKIKYCKIEYGTGNPMFEVIYIENASPTISYNTISNVAAGIISSGTSNPLIEYNTISLSEISAMTGAGISISGGGGKVNHNTISISGTMPGTGISISGAAAPEATNNTITGNLNSTGINVSMGSSTISNNLIENNNIGISCGSGSHTISYNIIRNNKVGLQFHDMWDFTGTIGNNNIYNNTSYDAKISSGNTDVNVPNNWWGTTDTNLINQHIYDYYDNFELGKILYTPILTSEVANAGPQGSPRFYTRRDDVAYRFVWCAVPYKPVLTTGQEWDATFLPSFSLSTRL